MLVDGAPVLSCLALPAELEGREITTVEGMAEGGALHPLQQAFAELGAAQCGYCTPGILLTAQALLAESPSPTRDEIREALAGNLCRCTGYTKILDAVELAALRIDHGRERATHDEQDRFAVVGQPLPKIDAWAKVTGETRYADDLVLPRMAFGKLLRSPHPHARIIAHRHRARPRRCPASTRSSPATTCPA